jgi:hypothetical protein
MAKAFGDVRFQGQSGRFVLGLSISAFDPLQTSVAPWRHDGRPSPSAISPPPGSAPCRLGML